MRQAFTAPAALDQSSTRSCRVSSHAGTLCPGTGPCTVSQPHEHPAWQFGCKHSEESAPGNERASWACTANVMDFRFSRCRHHTQLLLQTSHHTGSSSAPWRTDAPCVGLSCACRARTSRPPFCDAAGNARVKLSACGAPRRFRTACVTREDAPVQSSNALPPCISSLRTQGRCVQSGDQCSTCTAHAPMKLHACRGCRVYQPLPACPVCWTHVTPRTYAVYNATHLMHALPQSSSLVSPAAD